MCHNPFKCALMYFKNRYQQILIQTFLPTCENSLNEKCSCAQSFRENITSYKAKVFKYQLTWVHNHFKNIQSSLFFIKCNQNLSILSYIIRGIFQMERSIHLIYALELEVHVYVASTKRWTTRYTAVQTSQTILHTLSHGKAT